MTGFTYNRNMTSQFMLVTTTQTRTGQYFVSMIEHHTYPFYGSQWQPEMNQFEFVTNSKRSNISHDEYGILVGAYFAAFFVNETRRNTNSFTDHEEEYRHLINSYNHHKYFTVQQEKDAALYMEEYRFPADFTGGAVAMLSCCYASFLLLMIIAANYFVAFRNNPF